MTVSARPIFESLVALLAPTTCSSCGEPADGTRIGHPPPVFCTACGAPRPARPLAIDGIPVVVAADYAPPLSDAIKRFKFDGHPELARPLSSLLAKRVEEVKPGNGSPA